MKARRILGIILTIGGIVLLGFSTYIKNQIGEGKEQIAAAQKKLDQGNSLFSLSPATKQIGQGITGGAQKKIDSANKTVAYYQEMADQLQVGGFVLIAAGVFILAFSFGGKKKK